MTNGTLPNFNGETNYMKIIKKALTLNYTEGVIVVTIYNDGSIDIANPDDSTKQFGKRTEAAIWFKKTYKSTLCF